MEYRNEKIDRLINERDRKIRELDAEIQKEIEKEKAKYKFSWKRFGLVMCIFLMPVFIHVAVHVNKKIFPKTSIWSWEHYGF